MSRANILLVICLPFIHILHKNIYIYILLNIKYIKSCFSIILILGLVAVGAILGLLGECVWKITRFNASDRSYVHGNRLRSVFNELLEVGLLMNMILGTE